MRALKDFFSLEKLIEITWFNIYLQVLQKKKKEHTWGQNFSYFKGKGYTL